MRRVCDHYGNEVTCTDADAVTAINTFVRSVLAYGKDMECILAAGDSDETCVLANAFCALLNMFCEKPGHFSRASSYLDRARAYMEHATERERMWVTAIDHWVRGDIDETIATHYAIVEKFPTDVFNAKIGQIHCHRAGDFKGVREMVKSYETKDPVQDMSYIYGMLAFGLIENGCNRKAEEFGRTGSKYTVDPWATHAVCHVMDDEGRPDEGIAWMEAHTTQWDDCNSFMYTHNWWHLALCHLEKHDTDRVMGIYDKHVWGVAKQFSEDQIGAASLLWRCELRDVPVVTKWEELSDYVAPRVREHLHPYVDMHFAYILARAGKQERVNELIESLEEAIAAGCVKGSGCVRQQGEVLLPAIRGVVAHANSDYEQAAAYMGPVFPRLREIGGSNSQQDVFRQTYIDSLIKSKQFEQARPILEARQEKRKFKCQFESNLLNTCCKCTSNH